MFFNRFREGMLSTLAKLDVAGYTNITKGFYDKIGSTQPGESGLHFLGGLRNELNRQCQPYPGAHLIAQGQAIARAVTFN